MKKKTCISIVIVLLAGLFLQSPALADYLNNAAKDADSAGTAEVSASASYDIVYSEDLGCNVNYTNFKNIKNYEMTCAAGSGKTGEIKGLRTIVFPYTDEFFAQPEDAFCREMAKCSFAMACASFINSKVNNYDYEGLADFYHSIGFDDIVADPYYSDQTPYSATYGIASKKIGDETVIAVVCAGQGYGREWAGNMEVGNEERHTGFNRGAQIVEQAISDYIASRQIEGDIVVWTTGFSRASAIANIVAADMTDRSDICRVYAYCFATPNTTKNPGSYTNIFSIVGKNDPVAKIPFTDWGYDKYGVVLYTPSVETNTDYAYKEEAVNKSMHKLLDTGYSANSDLNKKIKNLLGYACVIIPEMITYEKYYQETLMNILDTHQSEDVLLIAAQAISDIAERQETVDEDLVSGFVSLIEELGTKYFLQDNTEQTSDYTWNTEFKSSMANIIKEHLPDVYYAWIYSDLSDTELLDRKIDYYTFSIEGNVSVNICNQYGYAETISTKNGYEYDETNPAVNKDYVQNVNLFFEQQKEHLIITIPADCLYVLEIISQKGQTIRLQTGNCKSNCVYVDLGDAYSIETKKDEIVYATFTGGEVYYDDFDYQRSFVREISEAISLSSLLTMQRVVQDHVSIWKVTVFAILLLVFLVLELLVCLIIGLVRRITKKKRRKIPTLVIHLVNAGLFIFTAIYFKKYVSAYPWASMGFKIIAYLFLLTLSLKTLRKAVRTTTTILVNIAMLVVMALSCIFLNCVYPLYDGTTLIIEIVIAVALGIAAAVVWLNVKSAPAADAVQCFTEQDNIH